MIILASGSPRRREILSELNVKFTVITADVDESCDEKNAPLLAESLAKRKGLAVYEKLSAEGSPLLNSPIISADTVVFCEDEIMGKPRDEADAKRMLRKLSGRAHEVSTGICVISNGQAFCEAVTTKVFVDGLSDEEIDAYIATKDPFDKAGAYGIQGIFSKHISKIEGCYFNVVGLPTNTLAHLYKKATGEAIG